MNGQNLHDLKNEDNFEDSSFEKRGLKILKNTGCD